MGNEGRGLNGDEGSGGSEGKIRDNTKRIEEREGEKRKKDFFSSKICDSQYKKKSIRYYIESRRLEEFWTG